jgi:hypothetical protein
MNQKPKQPNDIREILEELVDDSYMNNMIFLYKLDEKVRQAIKEEWNNTVNKTATPGVE